MCLKCDISYQRDQARALLQSYRPPRIDWRKVGLWVLGLGFGLPIGLTLLANTWRMALQAVFG
jgi:hypothetical protein